MFSVVKKLMYIISNKILSKEPFTRKSNRHVELAANFNKILKMKSVSIYWNNIYFRGNFVI